MFEFCALGPVINLFVFLIAFSQTTNNFSKEIKVLGIGQNTKGKKLSIIFNSCCYFSIKVLIYNFVMLNIFICILQVFPELSSSFKKMPPN